MKCYVPSMAKDANRGSSLFLLDTHIHVSFHQGFVLWLLLTFSSISDIRNLKIPIRYTLFKLMIEFDDTVILFINTV